MRARRFAALQLAIAALVGSGVARPQPTDSVFADATEAPEGDDAEKRYTSELARELHSASADALLLFTEYTGRAGEDLKGFIRNISSLTEDTLTAMDRKLLDNASASCRTMFLGRLKKIEYDTHRAASFNGENHHKYLLGHMIVLRMHLNKSEDYVKKCERIIKGCGVPCETTPRMVRWRRLALDEINRVRDDLEHSRRFYRDILLHARRRLNHIRKRANTQTTVAIRELGDCVREDHK